MPAKGSDSMCPDCNGQRYYHYDVVVGHPFFGQLIPCPTCNQHTIDSLSGLSERERAINIANISTNGRPNTKAMKAAALEFINRPTGFLSFHGKYGNGKTTIIMAIVNALITKGINVRYLTASDLLAYMRDTFNSETKETDYDRVHELARIQVLCIDEMDKLRDTEYSREIQQELINLRYRDASVLGTILAWNGGRDAISMPAVVSRLSEFVVVENLDSDMRVSIGDAINKLWNGGKK